MARATISGLDRLNRKLYQFPESVKREVSIALEKGAAEIVALAKTLAPLGSTPSSYGGSNSPGALRDSINWKWGEAPKGTITLGTMRGPRGANDLFITIYAGDDKAFYARWVEFGTRPHTIAAKNAPTLRRGRHDFGKEVSHPGASTAHAFFYPAYRALRARTRRRISRAVNSAARRIANGGN